MDDWFFRSMGSKKYLDDQAALSQVQQLAFGKAVSTIVSTPIVPTAATNLYTTSTSGVLSPQLYYKVNDKALFMDNKLKISAFDVYTICTDDSMHKFDDTSYISSNYAITEYFNFMYYNNLLTPKYKCSYSINDTNNVVKHNNIFGQTFENIVQKSLFPIRKIASKWENLHKALI